MNETSGILCTVCFQNTGAENEMVRQFSDTLIRGKKVGVLNCKTCGFMTAENDVQFVKSKGEQSSLGKEVVFLKREVATLRKDVSELKDVINGKGEAVDE
jgi:hypothetical protein